MATKEKEGSELLRGGGGGTYMWLKYGWGGGICIHSKSFAITMVCFMYSRQDSPYTCSQNVWE